MLEDARHSHFGTAWWRDSRESRAIAVRSASSEPAIYGISFFAPDFALSSADPWLLGEATTLRLPHESLPQLVHRAEPSSAAFAQMHEDISTRIRAREFEKVVPIVCEELEYAAPLHAGMFARAIEDAHPHQVNYGFELAGEGLVGVTPELLFHVSGNHLRTMALAGTGRADGPSLLDDKKERHEHQLVIDHIVGELRAWGTPEVGVTAERVYGKLKHLYTPIELRMKARPEFLQLVVRLHPTAALGGWPRLPAVEWLQRQDFHSGRKRFGAPFGYVEGDVMACAVAIRCLQWCDNRALLSAGCGIVAESQTLKEWNELQLKKQATCQLLGLEL
jgi:menaquinone-specific isochorismate synthase